jgi:hypothetical protein
MSDMRAILADALCDRGHPDPDGAADRAITAKDARIAELEEALRWALAEIEGRTRYDTQGQQDNAHDLARAALTAMEQTNG